MTKVELEIEFSGGIFFPEIVDYMNLTVCRSGALPPQTLTRTFQIAACLRVRRPSRLLPASGVRISRFLPACVRRNQAQHPSCPSRTGGLVGGSCRCAPPPDPLGWALAQPRRSPLLARRRAACDSLNGSRRARAALMLSRHELSPRARRFACTFRLPC